MRIQKCQFDERSDELMCSKIMANESVFNFKLIIFLGFVFLCPICNNVSGIRCGRVNISRPLIYNGNVALRGEWPFIAALLNKAGLFCEGTLITGSHR